MIDLMHGDCLERMKEIPDGSVDMVLTDPPYGTVRGMGEGDVDHGMKGKTEWDKPVDQVEMLRQCNRILRMNGALILFCQEPYTSKLMTEPHGNLPPSYRLTWLKDHFANSLIAKKAPVNYTEDVCVFFKKYDTLNQHPLREYANRIMTHIGKGLKEIINQMGHRKAEHFFYIDSTQFGLCTEPVYDEIIDIYDLHLTSWLLKYSEMEHINNRFKRRFNLLNGAKFKSNVLEYKKDYQGLHPTQKPAALMEDLIKTYTNENETVLDFTMGSGTTGVAALNTNRNFIGIELDPDYFKIAQDRIYSGISFL